MLVDAGSVVTQGQPLLKLDSALADHQLAQQRAAVNAADVLQAERLRLVTEAEQLTAQQLFPQTELALRRAALAEAQAMYQQAQASLQQQQEIVARHLLTAPFSGVIATRSTDVGEWVALGTPVLHGSAHHQCRDWLARCHPSGCGKRNSDRAGALFTHPAKFKAHGVTGQYRLGRGRAGVSVWGGR